MNHDASFFGGTVLLLAITCVAVATFAVASALR
jgi:hypothetical protein